jgi:cell division septum initiation protein DivIVA
LELAFLAATVVVSGLSPIFLNIKVVEVLVPSMAAVAASFGLSAEYAGKVAVSNSKEVAALAIQATAEAEVLLASAERAKAILPLCVGISTTASAFALLAPSILKTINERLNGFELGGEILLLCPLVAVLAAAVAGLATQESKDFAARAKGLGNRRFASSSSVGRTWLSSTEQVEVTARRTTMKWQSFAIGVLPAPIIASFCPGILPFKTIVCAAVAAAQAAYYLAIAEYFLASSVEAVALKARASAVADTYANQSGRNGAILPFTSALAGLCAAASAAAVELLPLVSAVELQSLISVIFPTGAALFAAAASVARARCEVINETDFFVILTSMY